MAVSFFLCPSLSVILWGHVRLLGCPDVFSYLSAFQQVPSSPPPLSLFFPSFTLSLSLSLSISPQWGIDQCFQVINMHLCHSIFSLISPQCQQRVARREEWNRKKTIQIQMKVWKIRRDNVRTQKKTVILKWEINKEWVINIHSSCHGCVFLSLARGSSAYVYGNERKHRCGIICLKYNLLSLQSNKNRSIWLTLLISPFLSPHSSFMRN